MIDDPLPIHPSSLPRRTFVKSSLASAAALTAAGLLPHAGALAQDANPTFVAGSNTAHAFEFVGVIHQQAFDFQFYGFLTRVAGIEPTLLFTTADPTNRDAASARLTISGTFTGTSRSVVGTVFDLNAEGTFAIFYSESGGADSETPESFAAGTQVAGGTASIQNVIAVYAPQSGLANGNGDFIFTASAPFTIAESTFQFGIGETPLRIGWFGVGQLLDPTLPESLISIAGNGAFS